MSTTLLKKETLERKWYVIDAAGKPLGRTAVIAANILRGKHPFRDTGNFSENGVSRRVRGEERRERKGSGSGWDGGAVECRKETAPGLWHGSGVAEKRGT